MRILSIICLMALSSVAAASEPPNARTAFVERRGLLEIDSQCRLLDRDVRYALSASAGQARGTLLRAGWSRNQVDELEQTVIAAARARSCDDARTRTAAADAREGFGSWLRANAMSFQGWARAWEARRVAGADGWRLRQAIDAPVPAQFGVRAHNHAEHLVLLVPLARNADAPQSAQLIMRDAARGAAPEFPLQQRISFGLEAGAPAPGAAGRTYPSTRNIERAARGGNVAVFTFPDDAFRTLLALDPRESVEIDLATRGATQRVLVEVGDIAAARAFLAIGG